MNRKLQFLICGAQKSGTTALYDYLRVHPDIFLPDTKELHIFDNENEDWTENGIETIDERISAHFKNASNNLICGEATPVSLFWWGAPKRIWQYNLHMKLIIILRNPITRAYSHWNMEFQRGRDRKQFNASLVEEENRCREALPLQHRVFSYLERGFYSNQIKNLWRFFPREQTLIIKQEELINDPRTTLRKIYSHLEVRSVESEDIKKSHTRNYHTKMQLETKMKLLDIYTNEITEIEKLLAWDCSDWRQLGTTQ